MPPILPPLLFIRPYLVLVLLIPQQAWLLTLATGAGVDAFALSPER